MSKQKQLSARRVARRVARPTRTETAVTCVLIIGGTWSLLKVAAGGLPPNWVVALWIGLAILSPVMLMYQLSLSRAQAILIDLLREQNADLSGWVKRDELG